MRVPFAIALLCLPMFSLAVLAADAPVVVSKVHVNAKTTEDLDPVLPTTEGVSFALVLSQPISTIIGIDEKASRLIAATDDKKTDFTKSTGPWLTTGSSKISANRHKIAVPITFSTLPAAGATSIQFKADLVIICGINEQADNVKLFDFAKGASGKFGKHTIELKASTAAVFDDSKGQHLSVTLNEGGTWLKKIEFFNRAGKPIKAAETSSTNFDSKVTKEYLLDTDLKAASVRLTYYQKVEPVTQTVDLKVGLGLE